MKKITYLILLLLAFNLGYGQTKIAELNFESAGGYTTSVAEFTDDAISTGEDYFIRTDGSNIGGSVVLANVQGNYYFAAQDIDGEGATLPVSLLINNINISGYTNLQFRVHLAEDDDGTIQDWDNPVSGVQDYLHITYDIDNTGVNNLLWVEPNGPGSNNEPSIDTDFDGTGDGTVITNTFTQFTENIVGSGALLDIEFVFSLNAGEEDIAIDNIEIWGIVAACGAPVTWNGTTWDNAGVGPDITTPAIINGSYNALTNGGSFSACSLTVNGTLIIDDGYYVEVENDVIVDGGTITVENHGAFVQNDDTSTFSIINGGTAAVAKTAVKNTWYDYTYWSSPVNGLTIATSPLFLNSDRRFWYNAANFLDGNADDIDDNGDDWQVAGDSYPMTAGVGFAASHSQIGWFGVLPYGYDFFGEFNNGVITTSISYNGANGDNDWNLIGNPYPCALDFDAFYAANSSVVAGAAYLWSHRSALSGANPGNEAQNFSQNDYAIITAGSGSINNSDNGDAVVPNDYIPSGQGFFISGLANGTVTFNNSMRMADGTSNSQFFKNSRAKKGSGVIANKLWVNLTSDNGVFNQILVAYVDGATSENDGMAYDAPRNTSGGMSAILFSNIEGVNKKFAIQGKNPNSLDENEIIQLGFKTNIDVATLYSLSLDNVQGDFLTNHPIYLKDNLLNKVHDLSVCDYTFTSEVGEFNDRFVIAYSSSALLSTDEALLAEKSLRIVELEDDNVQFKVSNNLKIKTVEIYDLLGRALYHFKTNSSSKIFNLSKLNNTVFIAKVELSNGAIISRKAVKK